MISFIRPEVRTALWRWREVIAGAVLIAVGIWWILGSGWIMPALGSLACLAGALLSAIGVQRARFRGASGGLGMVDVDEGQVTYFGPMTGGAVALREMDELALIRSRQTPHWRLSARGEAVYIPVNADGADDLFDAFTALPGLRTERMLAALKDTSANDIVIWQRAPTEEGRRLH